MKVYFTFFNKGGGGMGLAPRVAFFTRSVMKLSHDLKNINIHLVNFFNEFFLITRQRSRLKLTWAPFQNQESQMSKNWYICTLHNTKVGYQITFFSFAKQIFIC